MLKIGDTVSDLDGSIADAVTIRLSELHGRLVVVYFYPKDNTAGCTREAQDFAALHAEFARHDATVVGVSRDSLKSHGNFSTKYSLPFALVADSDESWCRAFDVIHEKQLYGRRYVGIVRSTFLLDRRGRVLREWRNVKVPGHAQVVLDAVAAAAA